jgi:uncharacterized delta-60 repeat protein
MQISQQNLMRILLLLVSLLGLTVITSAAPGDLDLSFGNGGKVISPIGKVSSDYGLATALQSDGKIVVAGRSFDSSISHFMVSRVNPDGSLDTTFGTNGRSIKLFNFMSYAQSVAIQPDGKIVLGGVAPNTSGINNIFTLVRFNSNGSVDNGFGTAGVVQTQVLTRHSTITSVVIQPDGKIIAAGYSGVQTQNPQLAVARYNPDGTLDTSFGTNGISRPSPNFPYNATLLLQPDGKILIGLPTIFQLIRLNPNGGLDTSFDGDGSVNTPVGNSGAILGLALQPDGKIIAAGSSTTGGNTDVTLARYNPNGELDTTFDQDGIVKTDVDNKYDLANAVQLQTDGKIVIAGTTQQPNNTATQDFLAIRYLADGALDTSFDGDGKVVTPIAPAAQDVAQGLIIQPDGKAVLVGSRNLSNYDIAMVRYNADGALDATFDGDGISLIELGNSADKAQDVAIQPDGKILAAGYSFDGTRINATVARYNPTGTLDASFGSEGVATAPVGNDSSVARSILVQPDGKIVVGGQSGAAFATTDFLLVRFNADGTLDSGFGAAGIMKFPIGTNADIIQEIALQPDGKIVAAGYSVVNSVYQTAIARVGTDGTLDSGFGNGGKILTQATFGDNLAQSVGIQPDGKIVVAGSGLTNTDSYLEFFLLRYDSSGALDNTFDGDGIVTTDIDPSSDEQAFALALQTDGKLVVAGISGVSLALVRYNANGSLDTSFDSDGKVTTLPDNFEYAVIQDLVIQPDGKLVAAAYGSFTNKAQSILARYNTNGSLDATFADKGIAIPLINEENNEFNAVALQSDGKIVAAGYGSRGGGIDFALARFQSDTAVVRNVPFDFDGDGKTDVGIFRSSDGSWWYSRSLGDGFSVYSFGTSTDIITPGDYTGDGKADIAIFRPSSGFWFIQRSEDSSFFSFPFGATGDIPAPSDFDGDGKIDAAVFRPSSATWFIRRSSDFGTTIVNFGTSEDKPVPSDYDGDGKSDIAIFRPSDGSWWYLQSTNSAFGVYRFGLGTDKPVEGDYTGDGKTDIAVFRPTTGEWFIQRSENGSFLSFTFGANGDVPAPGDYDGDGKFDPAVFRPSTGEWFVLRSTAGILITTFGISGDRPIPNSFVP